MKTKLSIVIPIFNEEGNIDELTTRLINSLKNITKEYEIIFINDGSLDNSLKKLLSYSKKNKRLKIISFSRNFGHMPSVYAGLKNSIGEKVVIMDADLQDPPEVIANMYKKSQEGYDVVYGVKQKRKEIVIKRFLFLIFYRILNQISPYKMPLDAGTFSILDRKVVNVLIDLPERNKYFSGLRAWTGFSQTGVIYERGARFTGKPASLRRLLKLAFDGFFSFSYLPLRIASLFGFIFASLAFIFIIIIFILRFVFGWGLIGWASTISAILLIGGVQLITLGIIGEYLSRIYDEVKNRPEYIIDKRFGFGTSKNK